MVFPTTEYGYDRVSGFKASSRHPEHAGEFEAITVAGDDVLDGADEVLAGANVVVGRIGRDRWKLLEELAAAAQICENAREVWSV